MSGSVTSLFSRDFGEQLFDGPRVVDLDEAAQGASPLPPDGADGRNRELLCAAHAESHVPVRALARCSRNVVADVRFAQVAEQSHELVIPRSRTLDTLSRSRLAPPCEDVDGRLLLRRAPEKAPFAYLDTRAFVRQFPLRARKRR